VGTLNRYTAHSIHTTAPLTPAAAEHPRLLDTSVASRAVLSAILLRASRTVVLAVSTTNYRPIHRP
jgi:hypothetical protein